MRRVYPKGRRGLADGDGEEGGGVRGDQVEDRPGECREDGGGGDDMRRGLMLNLSVAGMVRSSWVD